MITEISAAIASAKTALEIAKAAKELTNYNELVSAVSEVSSKLLKANDVAIALQEKQSFLSSKIDELEQEVARLKNWEAERAKYKRTEISRGVFAYIENGVVGQVESAHKYCCHCFDNTIKSTLQSVRVNDKALGNCFEIVCQHGCKPIRFFSYKHA